MLVITLTFNSRKGGKLHELQTVQLQLTLLIRSCGTERGSELQTTHLPAQNYHHYTTQITTLGFHPLKQKSQPEMVQQAAASPLK